MSDTPVLDLTDRVNAELTRAREEEIRSRMGINRAEAIRDANEAERDALSDELKLVKAIGELLESGDPDSAHRARLTIELFDAYMENGPAAAKEAQAGIAKDLADLGYDADGNLALRFMGGDIQKMRSKLEGAYQGGGPDALLDYIVNENWKTDPDLKPFRMGGPFSDYLLDIMLEIAGMPTLDSGVDAIARKLSDGNLTRPQIAAVKTQVEEALKVRDDREEDKEDLMDLQATLAKVDPNQAMDIPTALSLAGAQAQRLYPFGEPPFASYADARAYLESMTKATSGLSQETGRSGADLVSDLSVATERFGEGASYVAALRQARTRMADDPGFRLWLQDRGISLPEGAMPSPRLAGRYMNAQERGKTSRLSRRPQATGQTLTYTVRAGKEYDIGATGQGGAPLYAVGQDGEYLTAAQLGELSDQSLPGASVIMARLGDIKRGQPLSAISALVAPEEKEQFEQELLAILNDKDKVGDARILVDKNTKTIQVVNRLGKVLQVHKPDDAAFEGAFASLSKQPELFSVAGSAAALSTGRGGNALTGLDPDAKVGSVLEGGIGVAIPEGIRLDATEPTMTFTDRSRRFFASQDPDVLHTMSGREINIADVVSIEDARTGEDVAAPPDGGVEAEPVAEPGRARQFADKLRARGVDRRYARHRRGFDAPVEHTVSRLGVDDAVPTAPDAQTSSDPPISPVEADALDVPDAPVGAPPVVSGQQASPPGGASPDDRGRGGSAAGSLVAPEDEDPVPAYPLQGGHTRQTASNQPLAWVRNLKIPRGYSV